MVAQVATASPCVEQGKNIESRANYRASLGFMRGVVTVTGTLSKIVWLAEPSAGGVLLNNVFRQGDDHGLLGMKGLVAVCFTIAF